MSILRTRLGQLLRSAGMRHGLIMAAATFVAGGLDYAFNVLTGRLLAPAEYGIFIAVTAILQVIVHLTNSIRNVVAFYTADLSATSGQSGPFIRRSGRWALRWGLVAAAALALLSPLIARLLQIPTLLPLLAASLAVLLLFVRPVTDGALQGLQAFAGLGTVQVLQAFLRLLIAALLIWLGWQSFGALLALPLASAGALLLALWLLRPQLRERAAATVARAVSWDYSALTLAGLLAFALLINMDAIVVKRIFSPEVAGQYGPVVTLGKMNLFVPLAMGLVLFPKVTQRQATGRDPRPILLLALLATLAPGAALTILYLLYPGAIVGAIFGPAYRDPGVVLALVGVATTAYAGINIWLNYALSLEQRRFVYGLAAVLLLQATGMLLFHDSLRQIATTMAVAGIAGNVIGALTTLIAVDRPRPVRYTEPRSE